jgi:AcrR family transcriptional regulator
MRSRMSAPQRRRQLLEVAGGLFGSHGFHGLSMEQLADAAGVSKPVLYQHFPSKRDLYVALVRDAVAALEDRMRAALEDTTENRTRVESAIGAYFGFVTDPRFQLLFTTADLADDEVRATVDAAMERINAQVAALIAEDAKLGRGAAVLLATSLGGLAAEGARWWTDHREIAREDAIRLLSRLAWRGLGSFDGSHEFDEDAFVG